MNYLEEIKKNKKLKYLFIVFVLLLVIFVFLTIYIYQKEMQILPETGSVEEIIAEEDSLDEIQGEKVKYEQNLSNLKVLRNGVGLLFLIIVILIFVASVKKQR